MLDEVLSSNANGMDRRDLRALEICPERQHSKLGWIAKFGAWTFGSFQSHFAVGKRRVGKAPDKPAATNAQRVLVRRFSNGLGTAKRAIERQRW